MSALTAWALLLGLAVGFLLTGQPAVGFLFAIAAIVPALDHRSAAHRDARDRATDPTYFPPMAHPSTSVHRPREGRR